MLALTRIAVGRPLAVVAIFLAVVAAGVLAYLALPLNLLPSVKIPIVTVTTVYPGAGPEEIELQITRPVEDAVSSLSDLDYVTSSSAAGVSSVTLTFTDRANDELIATAVERQVQAIARTLPSDAEQPSVSKLDLNQLPIMQLAVVGSSLAPEELFRLADEVIRPQIERLTGVAQVGVIGGRQQEIAVSIDPAQLSARALSLTQVQSALASNNVSVPAGSISERGSAYNLRVFGLLRRPEDLATLIVGGTPEAPVRLGDVSTVQLAARPATQITRVNRQPGVLLRVGQQNGANATDVTDAVQRVMPDMRAGLPSGSQLVVVQDNSTFIRTSINGVRDELILAVFLTAAVLMLFLHSLRVSLIVLLSIPTTLLAAFIVMRLLGFSLNVLSTLGLTLSIGILVDDSIVVLENILRRLDKGEASAEAAVNGRAEIGLAALAITLVDVVIFAPVGLVSGQIGGFFKEFGFTVAAVTLLSLVVSFTLTPLLASRLLHPETDEARGPLARFGRRWDRGFAGLERFYARLLGWSISGWHRAVVLLVALASLVVGLALVASGAVGIEFSPQTDEGIISISTTAPPGTSLEAHDATMRQVEAQVEQVPEVQLVSASIGAAGTGLGGGAGGQATNGSVTVNIGNKRLRQRSVDMVAEDIRGRLANIPNVQIRVGTTSGGPGGAGQPVSVRLQGSDGAVLTDLANTLEQQLRATPGLREVTNSAAAALPELQIQVDQGRASQVGLSTSTIGSAVRLAYSGSIATRYRRPDGKQIDVRIILPESVRAQTGALAELPLTTASGTTVRLGQVATITQVTTPSVVSRRDRRRVVNVGANLEPGVVQSAVLPGVQKVVANLQLPTGYSAVMGGQAEQQATSFAQLGAALGISILLAYLLMAVLYNSLVHPLAILFGLPVAIGGALVSTFLFRYTLNIFSMIGFILLVGLAIKNGILLIDRTNHNRARGMPRREALLEAGPARLRAIIMTSVTIAVALLPSALQLGEGAELRAPLAATVFGGVISSTLLTLVVVPVVYTLLDGLATRLVHPPRIRLLPRRSPSSGARLLKTGSRAEAASRLLPPPAATPGRPAEARAEVL